MINTQVLNEIVDNKLRELNIYNKCSYQILITVFEEGDYVINLRLFSHIDSIKLLGLEILENSSNSENQFKKYLDNWNQNNFKFT